MATKTLFKPTGTTAIVTPQDTSLNAELAALEVEHRTAEERRIWRIRRIAEIKRLQGKLPNRDESQRICGVGQES